MNRFGWTYLTTAALCGLACLSVPLGTIQHYSDSNQYLAMASGQIGSVASPFTSRAALPLLAHMLSGISGAAPQWLFVIHCGALAGFAWLLGRMIGPKLAAIMILATAPALYGLASAVFYPDAAMFALTAAALWLLSNDRLGVAIIAIALCIAVRDEAIILSFFIVLYLWKPHRRLALTCIAFSACALALNHELAGLGLPNNHGLPGILYLFAKIPVNLCKNLLGIPVYMETYWMTDAPIWSVSIPDILHLPPINVYFYRMDPHILLLSAIQLLAVFGILPTVLLSYWKSGRILLLPMGLLAVRYGIVMLGLGLCTGTDVPRLLAYAWPAFIIGFPLIWKRHPIEGAAFPILCGLQGVSVMIALIMPPLLWWERMPNLTLLAMTFVLLGGIHVVAYRTVRLALRGRAKPAEGLQNA